MVASVIIACAAQFLCCAILDGAVAIALLGVSWLSATILLRRFAAGARRASMATLGCLKAPRLQLVTRPLPCVEPMVDSGLTGFVLAWGALAFFAARSLWATRARNTGGESVRPSG